MERECANRRGVKSLYLKAVHVGPILLSCTEGSSIYDLSLKVQTIIPMPFLTLKKYLFYLVEHCFISYNGEKKIYLIEDSGWDLLSAINAQIKLPNTDINKLMIMIE
jgi:hypothetical protein